MNETKKRLLKVAAPRPRLDTFVSNALNISRAQARELCANGEVRVNGKRSRAGSSLSEGDTVEVSEIRQATLNPDLVGKELEIGKGIEIVFEDQWLLIINKPRETHSVRQRAEDSATIADSIVRYLPEAADAGRDPLEAGLVQRLDFHTSGLMIAAKSKQIWEKMHRGLIKGEIRKEYLALVEGRPKWERRTIEQPLVSDRALKKMTPCDEGEAVKTEATVCPSEKKLSDATIIRAVSHHTIRHQIRAHLSILGHPLVGDTLYGGRRGLAEFLGEEGANGFFLHAAAISFMHPVSGEKIEVAAESEIANSLISFSDK